MQALVFDVDGTLADTERDGHRVAFNRAFVEVGLDWEWGVALYGELLAVTGGKERIRHYLQRFNIHLDTADPDALIADLHKIKTKHYKAMMEEGLIPLRPGVERLLREALDANIRLAIATTTTMVNVTSLISSTLGEEAIHWFEVIGAGDIVPHKKPAPDIYTWVLHQLNLQGRDVIAFEDSENGVHSAADAGIERILVTINDYTKAHDFSRASVVLDGLGEPGQAPEIIQGNAPAGVVDIAWLAQC